jgi:hypothetical protein
MGSSGVGSAPGSIACRDGARLRAEPGVAAIRSSLRQGLTPEEIALSFAALLVNALALPLLPGAARPEASA